MKARQLLAFIAACCLCGFAAEKKPLTNADVIKMVKAELPESTILMAIQANPSQFDSSVDALLDLKTNGVPPAIMEAMLKSSASAAPGAPATEAAIPPPAPALPLPAPPAPADALQRPVAVAIDRDGTRTPLPWATFKIVETKAKRTSVAMLVTESAVTEVAHEAIRVGANNVLTSTGGRFGGTIANAASGVRSLSRKLFKSDEVTLTYVYALDGRESPNPCSRDVSKFELNYAELRGAEPGDFEPAIIKLTATPKEWRMVGAMKARKSEFNESTPREITIIEDRIPAALKKLSRGHQELTLEKKLEPGDYAIVLRPADARKKFLLPDFEQEQGEAAVLRWLWDFRVPPAP